MSHTHVKPRLNSFYDELTSVDAILRALARDRSQPPSPGWSASTTGWPIAKVTPRASPLPRTSLRRRGCWM